MDLFDRPKARVALTSALRRSPVAALLGPRQVGKTTLARQIAAGVPHTWFDLEDPEDIRRLEVPKLTLGRLTGLVVIDEVQRQPDLFALLRVLVDRTPSPAQFLLLGSAAPTLVRGAAETLAGRIEFVELGALRASEVNATPSLWLRGGFPRAFLASSENDSLAWRRQFIATFLERDLPQLSPRLSPPLLRRFWTMLAHYHGQTWNGAEIAGALGVTAPTARHYLDLLTGCFLVRQLLPWFENVGKRLVRSPKVYVRDTGLLHALLDIETEHQLGGHPKVGASWEGHALEQVLAHVAGDPYFWGTHGGGEVDLLLQRRAQRWGFEFKRADAPRVTRSMRNGIADLGLDHLWVVYPGDQRYPLDEKITVLPIAALPELARQGGDLSA